MDHVARFEFEVIDLADFDVKFVDSLDVVGGAEFVISTRCTKLHAHCWPTIRTVS